MATVTGTRRSSLFRWVKNHFLLSYYAIALIATIGLVLPLIAAKLGWISVQISSNWHILGALGPTLAALVVVTILKGRAGVKELLGKFALKQAPLFWYGLATLSPFAMLGVSFVLVKVIEGNWPDIGKLAAPAYFTPGWGLISVVLISLAYGFGEETGWRGFLLPYLQHRYNPLIATLLLSLFWTFWHTPFFIYRYDLNLFSFFGFYVCLLGGTFWLTFLYNQTKGSLLAVALWHAGWDIVNLVAAPVSPTLVMTLNLLIMVIGPLTLFIDKASWIKRIPVS